ncbi:UNVERIFIED_CONTAM: hypothetical protein GTU68_048150 [Idotea baltica]|nr:hypothetical protein [Idotea baltica]
MYLESLTNLLLLL